MTSYLSKWIRTGAKEKGELEEGSYKILSQFYKERKNSLYHTADGVVACRRRDEEKILNKHNLIILPQLYQTEVFLRSHNQLGHQGRDKMQQKKLHRFDRAGMRKACERWVNACFSGLQRLKKNEVPSQIRGKLTIQRGCEDRSPKDLHDGFGI